MRSGGQDLFQTIFDITKRDERIITAVMEGKCVGKASSYESGMVCRTCTGNNSRKMITALCLGCSQTCHYGHQLEPLGLEFNFCCECNKCKDIVGPQKSYSHLQRANNFFNIMQSSPALVFRNPNLIISNENDESYLICQTFRSSDPDTNTLVS